MRGHHTSDQRAKIIYVMGAGRSGSTILGLLLGHLPGVSYLGELDAWLRRSGRPNFGGPERTHFWERVAARTRQDSGELFGDRSWLHLEVSTSILSPLRPLRRRLVRSYMRASHDLLHVLSDEVDGDWIVDTSHYPLRLKLLQSDPTLDIHVVYLYRTPAAVVASFANGSVDQGTKHRWAANAYLWLTAALSTWVYLRTRPARRHFVRFEDVTADPQTALAQLTAALGLSSKALRDTDKLDPGVAFQGNRLLAKPAVRFAPDHVPAPADPVTSIVQAPWLLVARLLSR